MSERGKLLVISGPSGAGKSTVVAKAIEGRTDICFSTSVTTRSPRPGEVHGREYFFVNFERFREMVENDELLEHAEYVANRYGTPRSYVEKRLDEGMNVLLDIEVQGARQVRRKMPEAILIFIAPPSLVELERRLRGRGTDTERAIEGRLIRARQEYQEKSDAGFVELIKANASFFTTLGILFPFLIAAILKTAQGSSTVAMTTTAGLMGLFSSSESLMSALGMTTPLSAALVVMAIGAGAMTVSHANDSYFWVVTRLGGLNVKDGYRTQTKCSFILGITSAAVLFVASLFLV